MHTFQLRRELLEAEPQPEPKLDELQEGAHRADDGKNDCPKGTNVSQKLYHLGVQCSGFTSSCFKVG